MSEEEALKQVWGIKPYTVWRVMCGCCGTIHTFDMTIQDTASTLIDDGWELRRTGPWCPGCCEDQRRRVDEIFNDHSSVARQPAKKQYGQIKAEDLQVGIAFIYGQSWHKVLEIIDIDDKIMLRSQSMSDQYHKPNLCILKRTDMQTIKVKEVFGEI